MGAFLPTWVFRLGELNAFELQSSSETELTFEDTVR